MAGPRSNLLLGRGESLLTKTQWPRPRGKKEYFYSLADQREALGPGLRSVIAGAPKDATAYAPRGEVTAKVTLHPEFLAKSYFPTSILRDAGVRVLGSRAIEVTPRAVSKQRSPKAAPSAELFVAGDQVAFQRFDELLSGDTLNEMQTKELCRLEAIDLLGPADRLRLDPESKINDWFEAVLHMDASDKDIREAFEGLVKRLGGRVERVSQVPGLAFAPLQLSARAAAKLAKFSHLRVLRTMPVLSGDAAGLDPPRTLFDHLSPPALPRGEAKASDVRVAIFDGGVLPGAFAPWVTDVPARGVPAPNADDIEHGTQVTSAYLFGPINPGGALPVPYTTVDHVRVLPSRSKDERVIDVIERVMRTLNEAKREGRPYALANLSLGPKVPMADDDVHEWTVRLDQFLAQNHTLMFIAAGNDGLLDQDLGRVQPPSDAINAIAVGAADSCSTKWNRADYSGWGPGRSPGFVKPDGVAFGGSQHEPLRLFHPRDGIVAKKGTSYASPIAMRSGGGVLSQLQRPLSPAALQALLIASAHFNGRRHDRIGVGWGRFQLAPEDVLYSPEDEARIIYEGVIRPGEPLRARIPLPQGLPECAVELSATFCYRAPTDPAHPVNYTRAGLIVRFRPDGQRSEQFFAKTMYDTEVELRRDALRWDTSMHRTRTFTSNEPLSAPCFDINYQTREEGRPMPRDHQPDLPFALVVRIRAEGITDIVKRIRAQFKSLAPVRLRVATRTRT